MCDDAASMCDDAAIMSLVVSCCFFPLGLTWCCTKHAPLHQPQCPFIQMIDTDATFLPNCNNMDPARSHV
jgi:hypothetical protein